MRLARLLCLGMALCAAGCMPNAGPRFGRAYDIDTVTVGAYAGRLGPPPVVSVTAAITPAPVDAPYTVDTGDRLRVVVFGQESLTNSYSVDAAGAITMPLIGAVHARGLTPAAVSAAVATKLRQGYVREPHVAVEVEAYRPFFILGEVTYPGQYPFVAGMTVETAVAIAGGFTPRALREKVELSRPAPRGVLRSTVPVITQIRPGDTVVVAERWF